MIKEKEIDSECVDFLSKAESDLNGLDVPCFCSQRWILAYLGFVFGTIFSMYRIDMSMAVVCMVKDVVHANENSSFNESDNTYFNKSDNTFFNKSDNTFFNSSFITHYSTLRANIKTGRSTNSGVCDGDIAQSLLKQDNLNAEFTWDRKTQSVVLSAFFYGFVTTQIAGGWITGRYGGKNVITINMLLSSVFMMLIPVLARYHVTLVIVARIMTGFVLGPLPPAWFGLLAKWALPNERGRIMMMFWIGQTAGSALGITTSGLLCAHGFDHGWGSIFYLHGITGVVFVVFWVYLAASSPNVHPKISAQEKRLISKHLKTPPTKGDKVTTVPWLKILSDITVWAIFITQLCDNWLYYLILTSLPMFVNEILKFDIQSNGFYSALPFMVTVLSLSTSGVLADYINRRRWVSRTANRKIFQITSLIGSSCFLVMSSYMPCDKQHLVILCISVSTFFLNIAYSSGYPCNLVDMAPRYASLLYAISNTIGASTGFVAPLAVGFLTTHKSIEEWRFVFWISAGIATVGAVVYALFSTSELLPWDDTYFHTIDIEFEEKSTNQILKQRTSITADKDLKDMKNSEPLIGKHLV